MKPQPSTKALLAATLIYPALLWLVSGLLRTGSFVLFAGGLIALSVCLVAARYGRARPFFILSPVVILSAVVVGTLEGALRLAPSLLVGELAESAFGRYHALPGGIYTRDAHLGYALKPDCSCKVFWSGHWWHHQTNSAGFRGPAVEHADAVFLGDSMIYGHGVENDQTVSSFYGARTGQEVANLGQQGTCLVQMAWRLRHTGLALGPRLVFVCSHFNDIDEAVSWYPEAELRRFVDSAPQEEYEPLAHRSFWPRPWYRVDAHVWDERLAPSLCLGGALRGMQQALAAGKLRPREFRAPAQHEMFVPSSELVARPFAPWQTDAPAAQRLGWQVHCRALARMERLCRQHGAKLVLFDLGYPTAFSEAIEDQARKLGVTYSPAGRVVLQRALAGEEMYLVNDGHWSPQGSAAIAEVLSRVLPD
jgi:hypothetical protein